MRRAIGLIIAASLTIAAGAESLGEQLMKSRVFAAAKFPFNSAASAKRVLGELAVRKAGRVRNQ